MPGRGPQPDSPPAPDARASEGSGSGSGSESGSSGSISVLAATALGVGGMMGAGLYTLIGLASASSDSLLPLSFMVAGGAALFSVYSYARLGATFPSRGGAA